MKEKKCFAIITGDILSVEKGMRKKKTKRLKEKKQEEEKRRM